MSEEMAVSDNTTGEEANVSSDETAAVAESEEAAPELPSEPAVPEPEECPAPMAGNTKLSHNLSANITTYFIVISYLFFTFYYPKLQLRGL